MGQKNIKMPKWASASDHASVLYDMALELGVKYPNNRQAIYSMAVSMRDDNLKKRVLLDLIEEEAKERRIKFEERLEYMRSIDVMLSVKNYKIIYSVYTFKAEQLRWLGEFIRKDKI